MTKHIERRSFASDNNASIHPEILAAIGEANQGHVVGYGDDIYTERVQKLFQKHLGSRAQAFLVFNGTAANVLCMKALTKGFHGAICSESAHMYVNECGAPEKIA